LVIPNSALGFGLTETDLVILAVHCVAAFMAVRSTLYGPAELNIILVGVWADETLGVAAGPKNQVKLPFAGKD